MICSSRRPVRSADLHVLDLVRGQERGHELVGRHRAAEDEAPRLELAGELALGRDEDERAAIEKEALLLEPCGDRRGGFASLDGEGHLVRVRRGRGRELRAEVLFHEVGDERHPERGGVVGRPTEDGVPDDGAEDRDQGHEHEARQDEGEQEELQDARHAPATTVVAAVRTAVGAAIPSAAPPP